MVLLGKLDRLAPVPRLANYGVVLVLKERFQALPDDQMIIG
jgi:hypothetical protein